MYADELHRPVESIHSLNRQVAGMGHTSQRVAFALTLIQGHSSPSGRETMENGLTPSNKLTTSQLSGTVPYELRPNIRIHNANNAPGRN